MTHLTYIWDTLGLKALFFSMECVNSVSAGCLEGFGECRHIHLWWESGASLFSAIITKISWFPWAVYGTCLSSAGMSRSSGWDCVGKWILSSVRWILLLQEQDLRILNWQNHVLKGSGVFFGFFFLPLSSKWKFVLVPSAVHLPGQEML